MTEPRLNRRQMVRAAAGAAAGGVLIAGTGVGAASADSSSGVASRLMGSWWVTHRNNGSDPQPGTTVVTFLPAGVILSSDISPDVALNSGSWTSWSNRFKATMWGGSAGPTPDQPGVVIRLQVWGMLHDGMLSGTFTVTVYASDLMTVLDTQDGTFKGKRLMA